MDLLETLKSEARQLLAHRVTVERRIDRANGALAEINRKLSAIQTVLKDVLGEETPTENEAISRRKSGSVTGTVKSALDRLGLGNFNAADVMTLLGGDDQIDERQVAKTLTRIIREGGGSLSLNTGVIRVLEQGAGTKSAVYRKDKSEDMPDRQEQDQGRFANEPEQTGPMESTGSH